jgi:hypothetical protein
LSSLADVCWGHSSLSLRWFSAAAHYLATYYSPIFHSNLNASSGLSTFDDMRTILEDQRHPSYSFLDLLEFTRRCLFTDNRDRVYGLLSLALPNNPTSIQNSFVNPDYTLSKLECYQKVAEKYLVEQQDPSILSSVQHDVRIREDWPSWVPDWECQGLKMLKCNGRQASGPTIGQIFKCSYNGHSCVSFRGLQIDHITQITRNTELSSSDTALCRQLLNLEKHHTEECVAWTATAGLNYDTGKLLDYGLDGVGHLQGYRTFKKSWGWMDTSKEASTIFDNASPARRFRSECSRIVTRRFFFQTQNGMLGIGPDLIEKGDVVVIIFGSNVPFVLRPVDGGVRRLVGECYVHDIMDSQAFRKWKRSGQSSNDLRII